MCLSSADFFLIQHFRYILSGIALDSDLVQTICKGYQQTALVGKETIGSRLTRLHVWLLFLCRVFFFFSEQFLNIF